MSKKHNHECKYCGRGYYFCDNCSATHHFMEVACSPECYINYQQAVLDARTGQAVESGKPSVKLAENLAVENYPTKTTKKNC